MAKSQRGNKEAKKPRKPTTPTVPAASSPAALHAPAERAKPRR